PNACTGNRLPELEKLVISIGIPTARKTAENTRDAATRWRQSRRANTRRAAMVNGAQTSTSGLKPMPIPAVTPARPASHSAVFTGFLVSTAQAVSHRHARMKGALE